MKKAKLLVALPLLATTLSALTACGNGRNKFAYDLDFTVDVSGTKIEMWTGFGSDLTDRLEDLLAEFKKLTGVTVEHTSKSSYDGCLKAVTLAATKGKYPHVVVGYPDHFASYVKTDIIVRLDYYFENDVHNPTFEPEGESFKMSDFYSDYMVENQSIEFDKEGNPYTLGVPFNKSTEVLIYNKTFFDYFAKLDDYKNKIYVPATYDEIKSVGEAILKYFDDNNLYNKVLYEDGTIGTGKTLKAIIDLSGITKPDDSKSTTQFKPFTYDSQANLFITSTRQAGGTYTEVDKQTRKGYMTFKNQTTYDSLDYLKGLYDKKVFGIPADWGETKYGSNPFKSYHAVMTLGSSAGVANDAPTGNKFDIAAAPVPYRTADKKFVISQGANLALLDKGSREERVASWQLIKFLSKYANGAFCATTGYYPSCSYAENAGEDGHSGMWANAGEDFDDYATWIGEARESLLTADQIRAQVADININYYVKDSENWTKFVDAPFSGSAEIRNKVASIPPWVFTGEKTPEDAVNTIYQQLSSYVR